MKIIRQDNFVTKYFVDLNYLDQGHDITQSCQTSATWRRLSTNTYGLYYNIFYNVKSVGGDDVAVYHSLLELTCTFNELKKNDVLAILKAKQYANDAMQTFVKQNTRNLFNRLKLPDMDSSISHELEEQRELSSIERVLHSTPIDALPADFPKIIAHPPIIVTKVFSSSSYQND